MKEIGLDSSGERVQMLNISSAMGGQFAIAATEMTEKVRKLGPTPLKRTDR